MNKEELFQHILKKNLHDLELECMCIIDMYNRYRITNTNIDCGFMTPKMFLTDFYESFKEILLVEIKTIFSSRGFNLKIELKEPYLFKGRVLIRLEIVDEDLKNELLKKKKELRNSKIGEKYFDEYRGEEGKYFYNDYCSFESFVKPYHSIMLIDNFIEKKNIEEENLRKKKWVFW